MSNVWQEATYIIFHIDRDIKSLLNNMGIPIVCIKQLISSSGTSDHSLTSSAFENNEAGMIPRSTREQTSRQAPPFLSPRSFGGRSW